MGSTDREIRVELNDGAELCLRPIEPTDKEAIAAGFQRLSPESRYRRFFAPLTGLNATDLRYLTEVDHRNHEAIIAYVPEAEEAVGVARFVRSEQPTEAEVAVTVVDDWQGRGVATALLERLVQRAREEGIERFLALVLDENEAAIELLKHVSDGDPTPRRSASGNLELVIELPERDAVSGTLLGRALRIAAGGEVTMNPWRLLKHRVHETAEHVIDKGDTPDQAAQPD
jgi:GNAT superfamily N-acetyltransferase